MKQRAVVTCLSRPIRLQDLGLSLESREVVYLTEEKARASSDLALAAKVHAVSLRYETISREDRKPPESGYAWRAPKLTVVPPLPPEPTPEPEAPVAAPVGTVQVEKLTVPPPPVPRTTPKKRQRRGESDAG